MAADAPGRWPDFPGDPAARSRRRSSIGNRRAARRQQTVPRETAAALAEPMRSRREPITIQPASSRSDERRKGRVRAGRDAGTPFTSGLAISRSCFTWQFRNAPWSPLTGSPKCSTWNSAQVGSKTDRQDHLHDIVSRETQRSSARDRGGMSRRRSRNNCCVWGRHDAAIRMGDYVRGRRTTRPGLTLMSPPRDRAQ